MKQKIGYEMINQSWHEMERKYIERQLKERLQEVIEETSEREIRHLRNCQTIAITNSKVLYYKKAIQKLITVKVKLCKDTDKMISKVVSQILIR